MLQAAAFGTSALFQGFYDYSDWALASLISFAVLTGLLLSGVVRLNGLTLLAVGGLTGLLAWSAASLLWAPSFDAAWTETNRVALYLVTLVIAISLIRQQRAAHAVVITLAAAGAIVSLYVLLRLIDGSGTSLFLEARLNEPVGYINGEAAFLLMSFWPLLAIAERSRRPLVRGIGLALATLVLELLILTQSRAIIPALLISLIVLVAFVPGRLRRGWALVIASAGAAAALPWLLDVYAERSGALDATDARVVQAAGIAATIASAGAGLVWALMTTKAVAQVRGPHGRRLATWLLVGVLVIATALAVASVDRPISHIRSEYRDFVNLRVDRSAQQRFTTAGGYRYDLWRIALDQFSGAPVKGVGAGNYISTFYLQRRHSDHVRQPHSLEMQMLAELGIVGALCLAIFLGSVLAAGLKGASARRPSPRDIGIRVAALGTFTVWLVHMSVDWTWNLPGITAMALICAAVLLRPRRHGSAGQPSSTVRRLAAVVGIVVVALLAASIGRQFAADRYFESGQEAVVENPDQALEDAARALRLNPENMSAYYLKAAAYARQNAYHSARHSLLQATRKEPFNHVPWALLGDLATRRGDARLAHAAYGRASTLNPFDSTLRQLAQEQVD